MTSAEPEKTQTPSTGLGMTVLLLLTFIAVSMIAAMIGVSASADRPEWQAILFGIVIGTLVGFVLTMKPLRDLGLVEAAIARLAAGLPVAPLPKMWEPVRFISEHINTLVAQQRATGELRGQLAQELSAAAAQEERNRLARDLHDSIKQQIFSISVSAAAVQARWEHDPDGARSALEDVRRSAHEAMVEMRAMLQQLAPAPLEKVGLGQALRDQSDALGYRSGAVVTADISELPANDRLPVGAQEAIFRVAQEALTNIARHARAQHASLRLCSNEDGVELEIVDDGQGFDPATSTGGMGMANMRTRAAALGGTLTVVSKPGAGSRLHLHIPLVKPVVVDEEAPEVKAELDKQFRNAYARYFLTAGAMSAVSLLAGFTLGFADEDFAAVGVPVSLILTVIALAFSIYSFIRARGVESSLLVTVGRDSSRWKLFLHYRWSATAILAIFTFMFLPEVLLQLGMAPPAVLLFAIGLLAIASWTLFAAYRHWHLYLQSLPFHQLKEQVANNYTKSPWNRWSWLWSLPMFLNLVTDFPPPLPPGPGDWLEIALPSLGVLLLVWGIWYVRYHDRLAQRIESMETA